MGWTPPPLTVLVKGFEPASYRVREAPGRPTAPRWNERRPGYVRPFRIQRAIKNLSVRSTVETQQQHPSWTAPPLPLPVDQTVFQRGAVPELGDTNDHHASSSHTGDSGASLDRDLMLNWQKDVDPALRRARRCHRASPDETVPARRSVSLMDGEAELVRLSILDGSHASN